MTSATQNAYGSPPRGRFVYDTLAQAQGDGFTLYDPRDSEGNAVVRRTNAQGQFELAIIPGSKPMLRASFLSRNPY